MATDRSNFGDVGVIAQAIKFQMRSGKRWEELTPAAMEALDQIATSIARIVTGEVAPQHWDSIISFAQAAKPVAEMPPPAGELERNIRSLARDLPHRSNDA